MSHLSTSKVKFPSAVTEGSAITGKLTGGNIIAAPHFLLLSCSFLSAASRRRFSPLFLFRDKARGEGPCSYICLKWARSGSNKEEVTAIPEVCRCDIPTHIHARNSTQEDKLASCESMMLCQYLAYPSATEYWRESERIYSCRGWLSGTNSKQRPHLTREAGVRYALRNSGAKQCEVISKSV